MRSVLDRFKVIVRADDATGSRIDKTVREIIDEGMPPEDFYATLIKFEDLRANGSKSANILDYIKAVEFCTYVVAGLTYTDAYRKTFPQRVENHTAKGNADSIGRYANIYANGELVGNIMARIYMNQYVMFIDKSIKAKLELYNMGMESELDRDRINALDKFLFYIKKDEEKSGIVNNISLVNGQNIVDAVDKKLKELSTSAQDGIEKGFIDAQQIAVSETVIKEQNND